jgi:hypothetical protein
MDRTRDHTVKLNKPNAKRQISCVPSYEESRPKAMKEHDMNLKETLLGVQQWEVRGQKEG